MALYWYPSYLRLYIHIVIHRPIKLSMGSSFHQYPYDRLSYIHSFELYSRHVSIVSGGQIHEHTRASANAPCTVQQIR